MKSKLPIKKMLCAPGKKNGYSIQQTRNNRKKPDQYGISFNPEYGDTPDCTNLHMSLLHQSVLVIVIWIPLDLICPMTNAKRKKDPPAGNQILLCVSPLRRKWRDELIDSSDPRSGLTGLEPAASALTGRCSDRLNYNPRKTRCTAFPFFFSLDFI